jgi:AraC-like DNA-binding protein
MKEYKGSAKKQLKAELMKHLDSPGIVATAIDGLLISRFNEKIGSEPCLLSPFIGIILQGKKKAVIGRKEFQYGEGDCIAVCMDSPAISEIIEASEDEPVLFVGIAFERYLFTQFEADNGVSSRSKEDSNQCAAVFKASHEIMDAFLRLMRLLDKPERISALAPLIIKEIHYLALSEPQSKNLRLYSTPGTHNANIAETIAWLKKNFRETLRIENLAGIANMSSPTFYRRFREITSFSPVQFQKLMRLSEARRLLLSEGKRAATVALEVGYDSVTQFNREYKRHFGEPPRRDAVRVLSANSAGKRQLNDIGTKLIDNIFIKYNA